MTDFRKPDEGKSGSLELPWDIAAKIKLAEGIPSLDAARELVIIEFLLAGDTRPFSDWVRCGYVPSRLVLVLIAEMMMPRPETAAVVPYQLDCRRRTSGKRGRPPAPPENEIRDFLFAEFMKGRMDEGYSYASAIEELHDITGRSGEAKDDKMIRGPYDRKYGGRKSASKRGCKG